MAKENLSRFYVDSESPNSSITANNAKDAAAVEKHWLDLTGAGPAWNLKPGSGCLT